MKWLMTEYNKIKADYKLNKIVQCFKTCLPWRDAQAQITEDRDSLFFLLLGHGIYISPLVHDLFDNLKRNRLAKP